MKRTANVARDYFDPDASADDLRRALVGNRIVIESGPVLGAVTNAKIVGKHVEVEYDLAATITTSAPSDAR